MQSCYRVRDAPSNQSKVQPAVEQEKAHPLFLEIIPKGRKQLRTPSPVVSDADIADPVPKKQRQDLATTEETTKSLICIDELSAAVDKAKVIVDLMMDDSDENSPEYKSEVRDWKRPKLLKYQNSFSCMHKSDGTVSSENPNALTIKILNEMGIYYDQMHDQWRTQAYRKAVTQLKLQTRKISTKEEALKLPGVGNRLAEKIEEIVTTNHLRRLESVKDDPTDRFMTLFLGIYGVGLSQASRWVRAGHRTFEDLQAKVRLTPNQKIGIEHYDDFQQRIPRAEVEKHGDVVRKALLKLDSEFQVTIGGSYRRGAETSGDIDLIITKPQATQQILKTIVMDNLVPELFKTDFFKVILAAGDHCASSGSKFHGASALPGSKVWRRIDLLLVPWNEIGAALIYFTGNDVFNRSIRLLARKKGMRS
jgi:DNA polymerase IV